MSSEVPIRVADRKFMIACYLADVTPPRSCESFGPLPQRAGGSLRLVTWNINILCGADWNQSIEASAVVAILRQLNADVLVLQEAPIDILDTRWDTRLAPALRRVRELDVLLEALGYRICRSHAENSTLLATRLELAVGATEAFTLDPDGPTASRNGDEVWTESRGARFAELIVPPDRLPAAMAGNPAVSRIGVYATHLSHKDRTLIPIQTAAAEPHISSEASSSALADPKATPLSMRDKPSDPRWSGAREEGGVRARQATELLRHWQKARSTASEGADRTSIILADFNAPVRAHYDETEWGMVAAGLSSPAVNQPLDDGVRSLLRSSGWRCAYDEAFAKEAASGGCYNNFLGRRAPPMTHWTGTTVDFAYVHGDAWGVDGCYILPTPLSDHLPVVVDVVPT